MDNQLKLIEFNEEDEIEERHNAIDLLNKDLVQIREIMTMLANIIEQDGERIEAVRDNVEKTKDQAENALNEIKQASKFQKQTICVVS